MFWAGAIPLGKNERSGRCGQCPRRFIFTKRLPPLSPYHQAGALEPDGLVDPGSAFLNATVGKTFNAPWKRNLPISVQFEMATGSASTGQFRRIWTFFK